MQESVLKAGINLEETFCEDENNLLSRMPRDTFDVLTMLHHDGHAFKVCIWLDCNKEANQ